MAADNIDREAPASRIAAKFGGLSEWARAFDPPKSPSTIHRWIVSGLVPSKHQQATMEAAARKRIKLKPSDFLPVPKSKAA